MTPKSIVKRLLFDYQRKLSGKMHIEQEQRQSRHEEAGEARGRPIGRDPIHRVNEPSFAPSVSPLMSLGNALPPTAKSH